MARSGFSFNRRTGHFTQSITITNTSNAAILGPISLVLDGLSPGVRLVNASGTTTLPKLSGRPYVNVGNTQPLKAKQSITILLEFDDPSQKPIAYTPVVLAGDGPR